MSIVVEIILGIIKWLFSEGAPRATSEDSIGFDTDAAMRKRIRDEWMQPDTRKNSVR